MRLTFGILLLLAAAACWHASKQPPSNINISNRYMHIRETLECERPTTIPPIMLDRSDALNTYIDMGPYYMILRGRVSRKVPMLWLITASAFFVAAMFVLPVRRRSLGGGGEERGETG